MNFVWWGLVAMQISLFLKSSFFSLCFVGERRLRQLESLFLGGPIQGQGQCFSIETLLDVLLVLYDECCNSSLRREKTVSEFIEFGEPNLL